MAAMPCDPWSMGEPRPNSGESVYLKSRYSKRVTSNASIAPTAIFSLMTAIDLGKENEGKTIIEEYDRLKGDKVFRRYFPISFSSDETPFSLVYNP